MIPVSSKSDEKWEIYGRLKKSKWPTFGHHFEYLISFQNVYNCLNLSYLYNQITGFQRMCSFVDEENGLLKIKTNYQLVCLLFRLHITHISLG